MLKGAEVFERPGQTMGDLCKIGTSRSSNRLKSGPYPNYVHIAHCLGCVLVHYPVSRLIFSLNMASRHFGCFLPPKPPIFGPTWTWNDTWMGHKSIQHIFSHCLGCVLTHFPVSKWVIGLIWQPTIMVYFDPKKGHFWTPPDLEWNLERG